MNRHRNENIKKYMLILLFKYFIFTCLLKFFFKHDEINL